MKIKISSLLQFCSPLAILGSALVCWFAMGAEFPQGNPPQSESLAMATQSIAPDWDIQSKGTVWISKAYAFLIFILTAGIMVAFVAGIASGIFYILGDLFKFLGKRFFRPAPIPTPAVQGDPTASFRIGFKPASVPELLDQWAETFRMIERPETLTIERIESERNIELRRVLIERFGIAKFIKEGHGKIVSKTKSGILWRKELMGDDPLVFFEPIPQNSKAPKRDWIRVPADTANAQEAQLLIHQAA